MGSLITLPLDIPNVKVLKTETNAGGDYIITVVSTLNGTRCRQCGRDITKFHGYDEEIQLRHLPILGRRVYLRLRPKRYECPYCSDHPTTTQKLEWYDPKSPHTQAYEEHVLLQLVNSTVQDVSRKERLGYDAVEGILERRIRTSVDWTVFEALGVLGLDEIALKKGHRDFVAIVTARLVEGQVVVLAVLPDRQKETVKAFLKSIPEPLRRTLHTVCTDMWEGYVNAVYEVFRPEEGYQVEVVVDRFHVAEKYHDGTDHLRKKELKRLKQELSEEAYQHIQGAMWPLRKDPADLQPDETALLNRLFAYSPVLQQAYTLRENLTEIFEQPLSKEEATLKINAWSAEVRASGLKCFDSFLTTLSNWLDEITNYFHYRYNSGFVEGLNNKIKVIKRRCYGILNVAHLFQRLYLDLEGYRLFA
jgi:transposase